MSKQNRIRRESARSGAHQKAKKEAESKRQRHEVIGTLLFEVPCLLLSVFWLWPLSHIAFLWCTAFAFAVPIYRHVPSLDLSVRLIAAVTAICLLVQPYLPPNETEFHGWLTPGTKPFPVSQCPDIPNAIRVYFGSAAVCVDRRRDSGDFAVFEIDGESLLTLTRTDRGLTFSAKIYDENAAIAEIDNGEFTLNPNNIFKSKHPDSHTLVVYDRWDKPIFHIEFLNPDAVLIAGRLFYPNYGTIEADESVLSIPHGGKFMGGGCIVGTRACVVAQGY